MRLSLSIAEAASFFCFHSWNEDGHVDSLIEADEQTVVFF